VKRESLVPSVSLVIGLAALTACATSGSSVTMAGGPAPTPDMSVAAPSPDPRVGLKAGITNAGEAAWNLRLVSNTRPSSAFISSTSPSEPALWNSDLGFTGHYAIQGNFSGYQIWDIANPKKPTLFSAYICPGTQSDVSVYHNLLFESSESLNGRTDCGTQGVADTVSQMRARGIRIYEISDLAHPKLLKTVQTCRGSHTHTVVTDPNDAANVYVYISGSAPVRSSNELAGCSALNPEEDANSELFRIEVIQIPVAHPEDAHVVSKPPILAGLDSVVHHGETAADSLAAAARRQAAAARGDARAQRPAGPRPPARGPQQCHDITVYPAIGLAGGACGGYGVLLDIRDPAHPKRVGAVSDVNFSFWHSATFNNDGTKVLFTDEWGGGTQPRCRSTDKPEWGADAVFTLSGTEMKFQGYYKLPAAQTATENCVAHNGSLVPVPGRDIMVQGWYQGGISMFDFTDPAHAREIAYFDRGPLNKDTLYVAGSWSAYWYNGYIYSSEIARGLDIFELTPSPLLSQNEIDAAKLVHFDQMNIQDQQKLTWPAAFPVARAYVDQLQRSSGLSSARLTAVRDALTSAEQAAGAARRDALTQLATSLDGDAGSSNDAAKVRMLRDVVRQIAGAQ
jgi:hypothetical protein